MTEHFKTLINGHKKNNNNIIFKRHKMTVCSKNEITMKESGWYVFSLLRDYLQIFSGSIMQVGKSFKETKEELDLWFKQLPIIKFPKKN